MMDLGAPPLTPEQQDQIARAVTRIKREADMVKLERILAELRSRPAPGIAVVLQLRPRG